MVVVCCHDPTKLVHFTHIGGIAQDLLIDTIVNEVQSLPLVRPIVFSFEDSLHPSIDHRLHIPSLSFDLVTKVIRRFSSDLFCDFSPVDLLDEELTNVGFDALVDEFLWFDFVLQSYFLQ